MRKIKHVFATGTGGMLGSAVIPYFRAMGLYVVSTSRRKNTLIVDEQLDVTDFKKYKALLRKAKPDLILHLAAETDLEMCEKEPLKAYLTNALGAQNAAILAIQHNIPVVAISSAGIFDGTKESPYTEFDPPSPINIYGNSKWQGEKYIVTHCQKYFIARAGWMVGGLERDKKFVSHMINQIISGAKEIFVVDDKFGAPTYAPDFATNLFVLIQTPFYGTYNMVCEGNISRYEIAREILHILRFSKKIKLTRVSSEHFKNSFFAPRPRSEALENYLLKLRGLNHMREWKVALAQYIKDLYHNRK